MTQMHSVEKIRVAHIVLTLDIGGAEVLISRMVRAMLDTQYQPYVICLDGGGALVEDIRSAGIEVDILSRQPGLLDRQCLGRVVDLLKAKEIQLIHSHNFEAHFYSVLAAKLARINKVIHTQHGMPLPYNWKKSLLMPLLGSLVGKFVGVSESVSTSSHSARSCLAITSCAIRSPLFMVNSSLDKFTRITPISPL